mgnify:CR=1 FL=1
MKRIVVRQGGEPAVRLGVLRWQVRREAGGGSGSAPPVSVGRQPPMAATWPGHCEGSRGREAPSGTIANSQSNTGVGVQARIPIYQGGLVGARVRQAQAFQSQLLEQGIAVERSVVAQTRAAFSSYEAALDAIEAFKRTHAGHH